MVIPEGVTSIPYAAFASINTIVNVVIPDSVTSIGTSAFEDIESLQYNEYDNAYYLGNENNPYILLVKVKSTTITSCKINENCKFINDFAFKNCSNLTSITIPDKVISLGYSSFNRCDSLTNITIGKSVNSIGFLSFTNQNMTIYYNGSYNEWSNIIISSGNNGITGGNKYFYSESNPSDSAYKYWHYVDGVPTAW